jgi:hypothetical protein
MVPSSNPVKSTTLLTLPNSTNMRRQDDHSPNQSYTSPEIPITNQANGMKQAVNDFQGQSKSMLGSE